jgi:lipoprotein-releasing system ATP-binding protein
MLEAKHIHKSFDKLSVLKDVSLTIDKGEVVSIIGASGAGKSTLLHILGTLELPDSGEVWIAGSAVSGMKNKKLSAFRNKHIGFVFQFHHLLPEFDALENVCIPAYIRGSSPSVARKEALAMLNRLGLEERAHHKPSELSGGEQQRVAVARALMNQPDLLLADEPTGNLDSKRAAELHQLFLDIRDEFGTTVVLVTHNESLAAASDRVIQMI